MNLILGGTSGLGHKVAKYLQEQGEETFVIGRSYDASVHGDGVSVDLANRQEVDE